MTEFQLPKFSNREEYNAFWKAGAQTEPLIKDLCIQHGLGGSVFLHVSESSNIIFEVDSSIFVKLYAPMFDDEFLREKVVLPFLQGKLDVKIPRVLAEGRVQGWGYLILTKVPGLRLRDVWKDIPESDLAEINRALGKALSKVHSLEPPTSPDLFVDWLPFLESQAQKCAEHQKKWKLEDRWVTQIDSYLDKNFSSVTKNARRALICADYHDGNLLVEHKDGQWRLTGIVDFADAMIGDPEYDFAAPGIYVARSNPRLLRAFFSGYGLNNLGAELRTRCFLFTLLHRFSALDYYLRKFVVIPDTATSLDDIANCLWPFGDTA